MKKNIGAKMAGPALIFLGIVVLIAGDYLLSSIILAAGIIIFLRKNKTSEKHSLPIYKEVFEKIFAENEEEKDNDEE